MYRSGSTRRKVSGRRQRSSIRATGPGRPVSSPSSRASTTTSRSVSSSTAGRLLVPAVAGHLAGDPGVPADDRGPHVRLEQLQQVPPGGPAGGGDPGQLVGHAGAGQGAPR